MQDAHDEITSAGGTIVAASPITITHSVELKEKLKLSFDLSTDPGNKAAREFGLVFTLPDELKPIYSSFGIDLPSANGDDSYSLPIPATYVITPGGNIDYSFVAADYTERMEPADIIDILRRIGRK